MRTILGQRPAFDRDTEAFVKEDEVVQGQQYAVAVRLKAVALITAGIDWAAYHDAGRGWTDAEVASNGDKLPEAAARALFPGVAERYRL